jgi:hypothetical protein
VLDSVGSAASQLSLERVLLGIRPQPRSFLTTSVVCSSPAVSVGQMYTSSIYYIRRSIAFLSCDMGVFNIDDSSF